MPTEIFVNDKPALQASSESTKSQLNLAHFQRSEHVFTFPRATPWAVQVAGLSGRRKMCELIWDNDHFITINLFTLSLGLK